MKFGLLGYGFMGGAHLAALQRVNDVEITSVATRTKPSVDTPTRGNLDIPSAPLPETVRWFPDWHQVTQNPEIDAIDVCLPTHMHKEVVLSAFRNGKHVFCEKPMALDAAECDELLEAARESDRVYMVGQVLRFMFPYEYAASFVREIGRNRIDSCIFRRSTGFPGWGGWLGKEECSGGAILDLLSHDLDQALVLFGQPQTVSAASLGPIDTMQATLRYSDGLEIKVEGGWFEPDTPFAASFRIEAQGQALVFEGGKLSRQSGDTVAEIEIPATDDGYFAELAYFVECCQNNSAPQRCLPVEAAQAVRISNLLKLSRTQGGRQISWQA